VVGRIMKWAVTNSEVENKYYWVVAYLMKWAVEMFEEEISKQSKKL